MRRLRVGHPLDATTEVGPLVHERHLEKVINYTAIAFNEEAETIEIANAVPFGLAGYVWTHDGGDYSFDFYMETKNVALSLGRHAAPRLGG